jgi:hypothetical protein
MSINSFKLRTELLIIGLCTIISSVAPMILIGAIYSLQFTILGFLFSVSSLILFEITIFIGRYMHKLYAKKKVFYVLSILVLVVLPFILLFFRLGTANDLIQLFRVDRFSPLFNLSVIIVGFVLLTILLNLKEHDLFFSMLIVTVSYLIPIFITFLFIPLCPNSEGKVLLGNVAMMYLFIKSFYTYTIRTNRNDI